MDCKQMRISDQAEYSDSKYLKTLMGRERTK